MLGVDLLVLGFVVASSFFRGTAITEVLDPMLMLPAPAQGALAVECRSADSSWWCRNSGTSTSSWLSRAATG